MAVAITSTDVQTDDVNRTTYTFTVSLGAADPDRVIVVLVATRLVTAGTVLNSATIAGVTATTVDSIGGATRRLWMLSADVPTGISGDVVVTLDQTIEACGIGVYRMIGAAGDAFQTAKDNLDPPSVSIDVPAGGGVIGGTQSSDTSTFTWTGLIEDYDGVVEVAVLSHSGANEEFATQQTALTVTATPLVDAAAVIQVASFGPLVEGVGSASGQGTATAAGASTHAAAGDAGGFALVQAVGEARIFGEGAGIAAGQATVLGELQSLLFTTTAIIQKPVDFWLPEQERLTPKSPNAVSRRFLRRIFRE